jgi:hypothetical protein
MNFIQISTTAYVNEDFFLVTELDEQDIIMVITPIVNMERDGYIEYTNGNLFLALKKAYPSKHIQMFYEAKRIVI